MSSCPAYLGATTADDETPHGPCLDEQGHDVRVPGRHTVFWEQRLLDFYTTNVSPPIKRSNMSDDVFGDSFTGGGANRRVFLKPDELVQNYVIMIEVKSQGMADNPFFEDDEPESAKNARQRLEVKATLTAFEGPEELAAKKGKEYPNVTINQAYLAQDLKDSVGKVEVYKLFLQPNKNPKRKASWTWRGVDGDVLQGVKDYYVWRQDQVAAALEADDTPDFLRA